MRPANLQKPPKDDFALRKVINPYGAIGFAIASIFAIFQEWSLPEFCWSVWLAGLVYTWICIATASVQIILTARSEKIAYEQHFAFLRRWSGIFFLFVATVLSVFMGLLAFYLYCILFGFYGVFLSVLAEMEPLALFGRNGFINSNFFTSVMALFDRFWPMTLGVVIANWEDFMRRNPWKRIFLPYQKEILRMHVLILALPFISLLVWALFGKAYQSVTIVFLMGLLYLLPEET